MDIKVAASDEDIEKCREVLFLLRPHLARGTYLESVRKTLADNRMLIFIEENGRAVSASVFEWGYNLYRGSYIYIDDLSSLAESRGKGYAGALLDWIFEYAQKHNIDQVHLDSGVNSSRWDAHRLYLDKRFNITSLHFARNMK